MATVFPVKDIDFKISANGRGVAANFVAIRGMETFSITFDNGIDEWNPLDSDGWVRRLVTSKAMTVSISGKRVNACAGNDYVASLAYQGGVATQSTLQIRFPNGDSLVMDCIVNVTASDGGSTGDVAVLEFDCLSDGRPVYTRHN